MNLIINNIDKINIDNRIIEIFIGDWEGKKKDDISQELVLNYRDGLYTPPNAETMQEVDYRVAGFVSELFESYDDTKILVITHNGVM